MSVITFNEKDLISKLQIEETFKTLLIESNLEIRFGLGWGPFNTISKLSYWHEKIRDPLRSLLLYQTSKKLLKTEKQMIGGIA